jgi:hypothetical protein
LCFIFTDPGGRELREREKEKKKKKEKKAADWQGLSDSAPSYSQLVNLIVFILSEFNIVL